MARKSRTGSTQDTTSSRRPRGALGRDTRSSSQEAAPLHGHTQQLGDLGRGDTGHAGHTQQRLCQEAHAAWVPTRTPQAGSLAPA